MCLEKNIFSNKVNKLRRCQNLVNWRNSRGKFSRQTLIARISCHLHILIYITHLTKIPTWKLFTEKSKAEKSPWVKKTKKNSLKKNERDKKTCCNAMFSREIVIYCHRHLEVLFFYWFVVLLGVIISGCGASCLRTFTS